MCNMIHEDSKILNMEKGIGFKIFGRNDTSMVGGNEYKKDKLGWARWKTAPHNQGVGFCVFTDEEQARRCCALWVAAGSWNHGCNVKKVRYSGAVCEHVETEIITHHDNYTVRLVKRFKILEDI